MQVCTNIRIIQVFPEVFIVHKHLFIENIPDKKNAGNTVMCCFHSHYLFSNIHLQLFLFAATFAIKLLSRMTCPGCWRCLIHSFFACQPEIPAKNWFLYDKRRFAIVQAEVYRFEVIKQYDGAGSSRKQNIQPY
jgi:hypothetical protein